MDSRNSGDKGIVFFKMSAHGNDFIIIDNTDGNLSLDWQHYSSIWCHRRLSVGANGLLVIEQSKSADFRLRIFNSDGSEAEMCGNGARCAAVFAFEQGIADSRMTFETRAGIIRAKVADDTASIQLTDPKWEKERVELDIDGETLTLYCVNTGVPHAVLFVNDVWDMSDEEVKRKGNLIRFHRAFEPEGTNVNFVEIAGPGDIHIRTYERGVEEETMACGTGAAASAIITHLYGNGGNSPFTVKVSGGILKIDFNKIDSHISDVWLTGRDICAYRGELLYEKEMRRL